MRRDLLGYPLHMASHGFGLNSVINKKTGRVEKWIPSEQILPLSDRLLEYFDHPGYQEIRDRAIEDNAYEIDVDKFEKMSKEQEELDELAR